MTTSLIVLLTLMPHGEDTHRVTGIDLEQRNVTPGTEWNDQLSQKRLSSSDLATGERRKLQQLDCRFDCVQSTLSGSYVSL